MNSLTILLILLAALPLAAQNLPDRLVVLDPLGVHRWDTAGFQWLTTANLYTEFSRYSNGSGTAHRWNAKTGVLLELARWDSTASVAFIGTTEVIIDPLNDITFNPRAIFWEEGVIGSFRLPANGSIQAGYVHRCKHDIDNLGEQEQRTLIYSGTMVRALWRPRPIVTGDVELLGALAVRNDFFLHLLDDRPTQTDKTAGRNLESLIDAATLTGRLDLRPKGARLGAHLSGSFMLSFFGERPESRFEGIVALGAVPFLELGLDLFNPDGAGLTLFARGEWQRDAGIHDLPQPGNLVMFGVRVGGRESVW